MENGTAALIPAEAAKNLTLAQDPARVLEDAQRAAAALQNVISRKPRPVIFNGEQFLEFEDWQTIGRFYGITAKTIETKPVEFGAARGFEAVAVAIDASGRELSRQESMCLTDEANWRGKPMFQIRSMAQTRACAKVLRATLGWIAVLAGYRPQTAEDIDQRSSDAQPIDYVDALRKSLLDHTRNNRRAAVEILLDLTGKSVLNDLTQTEAERAIFDFESKYLGAETKME